MGEMAKEDGLLGWLMEIEKHPEPPTSRERLINNEYLRNIEIYQKQNAQLTADLEELKQAAREMAEAYHREDWMNGQSVANACDAADRLPAVLDKLDK